MNFGIPNSFRRVTIDDEFEKDCAEAEAAAQEQAQRLKRAFSNPWDWRVRGRSVTDIRPGFFQVQIVNDGPWIPAVIFRPCPIEFIEDGPWNWLDRWPRLDAARDCDIFGRLKEPCDPEWVWATGTEISYEDWKWRMATRQHIYMHEPNAIDANPKKKIDLTWAKPKGPRE